MGSLADSKSAAGSEADSIMDPGYALGFGLELVLQLRDVSILPLRNQLREILDIVLTFHAVCTLCMGKTPLIVAKYPTSVTLDGFLTSSSSSFEASSSSPKSSLESSLKSSGLLILWLG